MTKYNVQVCEKLLKDLLITREQKKMEQVVEHTLKDMKTRLANDILNDNLNVVALAEEDNFSFIKTYVHQFVRLSGLDFFKDRSMVQKIFKKDEDDDLQING